MTWLVEPIAALDTETTSVDPSTARVVSACVGRSDRPGLWGILCAPLVNPGIPIPDEAIKIHGITNEQVEEYGGAPAIGLGAIRATLADLAGNGIPVVGHNLQYDLTVLAYEFERHGIDALPEGLLVLDTLVLFRRFDQTTGSRTLSALASRNGITFPAHDAAADALASLRLLHLLAQDNDLLPFVPVSDLMGLQAGWFAAQQHAGHYRRLGNGQHSEPPDTAWPCAYIPPTERSTA